METHTSGAGRDSRRKSDIAFLPSACLAATCAAAIAAAATCLASPAHDLPAWILGLSCVAAIAVATLSGALRSPSAIACLPPLIILAGAIAGIDAIRSESQGSVILLLGNIQVLSARETLVRFGAAVAAIGTLAVCSPSPFVARCLSVFALSGPGVLLLYLARARALAHWPRAGAGLIQFAALFGFLLLLFFWLLFLRRSRLLELAQGGIGRRVVPTALRSKSPATIDRRLRLVDGWIDPLGRLEREVRHLTAEASYDRQGITENIADALGAGPGVLPQGCRRRLEAAGRDRPESLLFLAQDELQRKRTAEAIGHLQTLASAALDDARLAWVSDHMQQAFGGAVAATPGLGDVLQETQTASRIAVFVGNSASREKALQRLMEELAASGQALPDFCRKKIESLIASRPEASIVLAEDELRQGRPEDALVQLTRLLMVLPEDPRWLPDEASKAWDRSSRPASASLQDSLWRRSQGPDGQPALVALAMLALDQGLAPGTVSMLRGVAGAGLLVACHDTHADFQGALPQLLNGLPKLPEIVVRRRLLPRLCQAAADSEIARQPWFFRKDGRPQLLEMSEAPLTSIYGGRIACWTFLPSEPGRQPSSFAVTGHAPGPVCARVSAILNDLANDRNCPSDLVLAGSSFFDLTEAPSPLRLRAPWNRAELDRRVRELAKRLAVEDVLHIEQIDALLAAFTGRVLQPTLASARESLAHVETEMGFVVNKTVRAEQRTAALQALDDRTRVDASESFPVLAEYRRHGKRLTVKIPLLCLGITEFERVVREYERAVRDELAQEWERRRRKYEEWSHGFAARFRDLKARWVAGGPQALSGQIYINSEVDPETATEHRLDPPKPVTELEYFVRLPATIAIQLAHWAWAENRLETLPAESEFTPHWARTCLMDAFLRGWPLPTEDKNLTRVSEEWRKTWRPLALLALDASLREMGLALSDVGVENTVFRVVDEGRGYLTLALLHVWDPRHDPLPTVKAETTIFASRFGSRRRTETPARAAQQEAVKGMRDALASGSPSSAELTHVLCRDSGDALDLVVEHLCRPLVKADLAVDIQKVLEEAKGHIDPLAGVLDRLAECSTVRDYLSLAGECGQAGRMADAVPDLRAWELYLTGETLRRVMGSMRDTMAQALPPALPWGMALGQGSSTLPPGVHPMLLQALSEATAWDIVRQLVEGGPGAGTIMAVLSYVGSEAAARHLRETYHALEGSDYLRECLTTHGLPPPSHQRQARSAPGCFSDWKRICYHLAEGDAALDFAWALRKGTGHIDRDGLSQLLAELTAHPIPRTFQHLASRRQELLTSLEKYQTAGDRVSLGMAVAAARQATFDVVDIAESAYQHAARNDAWQGAGWLRLARLKWLTAHFRESFSYVVGPPPEAALQACQLPLAIAVRAAGGRLSFCPTPATWNGPANATLQVSRSETGDLVLDCLADTQNLGRGIVSGLADADRELLAEFFERYVPAMLQSAGTGSFENWMRLVQVPNLGTRAALSRALRGDAEFTLLATACVLGVPDELGKAPGPPNEPRPSQWLDEPLVTSWEW